MSSVCLAKSFYTSKIRVRIILGVSNFNRAGRHIDGSICGGDARRFTQVSTTRHRSHTDCLISSLRNYFYSYCVCLAVHWAKLFIRIFYFF